MGLIELGDGQLPMKDFLSIKKNEFIKEDKKEVFSSTLSLKLKKKSKKINNYREKAEKLLQEFEDLTKESLILSN